jgi:hypothetical protein
MIHYRKWTHELGIIILMVYLMEIAYHELLCHVEPQVLSSLGTQRGLSNMDILEKSSKDLLYDKSMGCGKEFTQLHVVLELLKLKASHGWSDNIFLKLLSLLAKLLPKLKTLPTKHL